MDKNSRELLTVANAIKRNFACVTSADEEYIPAKWSRAAYAVIRHVSETVKRREGGDRNYCAPVDSFLADIKVRVSSRLRYAGYDSLEHQNALHIVLACCELEEAITRVGDAGRHALYSLMLTVDDKQAEYAAQVFYSGGSIRDREIAHLEAVW